MKYLISIDENGVYLRRTLCLTDNLDTQERRYDAIPFKEDESPGAIREALRYLREHFTHIQVESSRFETKDPHELRREQFPR